MVGILLDDREFAFAEYHAYKAAVGGISRFRSREDRLEKLLFDQQTGMRGELGGFLWYYGLDGLWKWDQQRIRRNENPRQGDNGVDFVLPDGRTVNIKSSRLLPGRCVTSYHLYVRPEEPKADVYVGTVVDGRMVHLLGSATHEMLPADVYHGYPFDGAKVLPFEALRPILSNGRDDTVGYLSFPEQGALDLGR